MNATARPLAQHPADPFHALTRFDDGRRFFDLKALERAGLGAVSRLPISLSIVLESLLRHCDGQRVSEAQVRALAAWQPQAKRSAELPFTVARILLQDLSGLPTLNDLAAMRLTARDLGRDPAAIGPQVPVDLVVDHQVSVDVSGRPDALLRNLALEYERNGERLRLLKWAQQAFAGLNVIPPGQGIVHQINLERLARVVCERDDIVFPDTLVATDSHTTMVGGIGVLGWGVGGIEAMAGMLGEPISFLTPDVVAVHLRGRLRAGVTATDLVLTLTEQLRRAKVVDKFVEFIGEGTASLTATDRATLANMAPDYGATCGFFAVDERTLDYLRATGRDEALLRDVEAYHRAQGWFGIPQPGERDYSQVIELDLSTTLPTVSGPSKPEQRLPLTEIGRRFDTLLTAPRAEGGFGLQTAEPQGDDGLLHQGDVLIAAITSCTNTANPRLMLAAGLLARKAVAAGLTVNAHVKTSLAPGSRVVSAYLRDSGLLSSLEQLGFHVVAHGCTTCMGNSGPLAPEIEAELARRGPHGELVGCAVLSGNRNFEARIHESLKANFLMSPALVVAFALAGTVRLNMDRDPLGQGSDGRPVYLRDLWPSEQEIDALMPLANDPARYRTETVAPAPALERWQAIAAPAGPVYDWQPGSTTILPPPFFDGFTSSLPGLADLRGARALAVYGDGLTTDHISPNATISASSQAGQWLREHGTRDLSSYAMLRCNHHVMVRGTFANKRILNHLAGEEGGLSREGPGQPVEPLFDVAKRWRAAVVPALVFGGWEYGTGSSRDWAARGPMLLGVRAVIARSFERIHRANLVGLGIVPCELPAHIGPDDLRLDGSERLDLLGLTDGLQPRQQLTLRIHRLAGQTQDIPLTLRADTPLDIDYLRHGGLMPCVLRRHLAVVG